MAMPTDTNPPHENPLAIERAVQWILADLLDHKRQPAQEDLLLIRGTPIEEHIQAFCDAFGDGGEIGEVRLKRVFEPISKSIDAQNAANGGKPNWLKEIRSRSVPPRPGTEEEQAEEKADPRFTKGKNDRPILKLSSIEDIYSLPDPEYLINRILQTASVSLLYGVSGTGKTFTCLDLALSVAHGLLWHGRRVKQGIVWYINTEGGRALRAYPNKSRI